MSTAQDKAALRAQLAARRATLAAPDIRRGGFALSESLLADPRVEQAACAAVYTSFGTEPSTRPLRAALRVRGVLVLVPYLMPDGDLDWVDDDRVVLAAADEESGRAGALHPAGPRLGPEALVRADVIVVPALAVAEDGVRLGRGGGCYDRALLRAAPTALTIGLLHDGELLPAGAIPAEPHDIPLAAAATPSTALLPLHRDPDPPAPSA